MGWQDRYTDASFRGVKFYVRRANASSGRDMAVHSYVNNDKHDYEDTGKKPLSYSITAFVLGEDYDIQRNKLEEALDTKGPAILQHPYRGKIKVVVEKWNCTEVDTQGGIATYVISFYVDSVKSQAVIKNDKFNIYKNKKTFFENVKAWFKNAYSLAMMPVSAVSDARDTIQKSFVFIDGAKKLAGAYYEFKREIENLKGLQIALSLNAEYLFDSFKDMINWGVEPVSKIKLKANKDNSREQIEEQEQISTSAETPVVSTPDEITKKETYPATQIQQLQRLIVIGCQAGLLSEIEFKNYKDAQDAQNNLFKKINKELEKESITDDVYASLVDLKQSVFVYMEQAQINLPVVIEKENPQHTDSLSLSYELYGSIANAEDIADINDIVHPGFIPAKKIKVKVYADA
jgi:prophage DNA circulation protein